MGKVIAFNNDVFKKRQEVHRREIANNVSLLFEHQRKLGKLRSKRFAFFRKARERELLEAISLIKKDIVSGTRMYCSLGSRK